jgi:transposase-like protein
MDVDATRYLGYSDVREAVSYGEKAVLLVLKYGVSRKTTARVLGVNLNVVRKAVNAKLEGRQIGLNGRPPKLSSDQDAELRATVEKMMKEHNSPTKRAVAQQVRPFFHKLSLYLQYSNHGTDVG